MMEIMTLITTAASRASRYMMNSAPTENRFVMVPPAASAQLQRAGQRLSREAVLVGQDVAETVAGAGHWLVEGPTIQKRHGSGETMHSLMELGGGNNARVYALPYEYVMTCQLESCYGCCSMATSCDRSHMHRMRRLNCDDRHVSECDALNEGECCPPADVAGLELLCDKLDGAVSDKDLLIPGDWGAAAHIIRAGGKNLRVFRTPILPSCIAQASRAPPRGST